MHLLDAVVIGYIDNYGTACPLHSLRAHGIRWALPAPFCRPSPLHGSRGSVQVCVCVCPAEIRVRAAYNTSVNAFSLCSVFSFSMTTGSTCGWNCWLQVFPSQQGREGPRPGAPDSLELSLLDSPREPRYCSSHAAVWTVLPCNVGCWAAPV